MASSIFNAGGGAGIGSYVIVFKNGILDPKTDFARLRGAYDSGDSIYLSLIGEGYDEALIPASGWVDEDDELHLVARDFDDGKTYNIDLGLNAHEAEVEIEDGIEINGAKIAEGASVPEPQESDRGLFLKVSDQGELEYAEGGEGGGVTEERVHEIVAEDTEDLVTEEELEEAISHATGKIALDIGTIARPNPELNNWYDLDLGEYTSSDFEEHKFVLTYKGMIMEEVGEDYLNRMHIRPAEMPGTEGETEAVFAFMGGDRVFIILFYRNGKGTVAPYGMMQSSAAVAVGDVNNVTNGYQDYDTELYTQVGSAVLTNQDTIYNLIDQCGPDHAAISVATMGEGFAQIGIGMHDYDVETDETLGCEASVYASHEPFVEGIEGLVQHSIVFGTTFDGRQAGNDISGSALVAAQAKWLEGTKDTPAADDSSLILRAPNITLQTANLALQTLDPTTGTLGEPSKLLFGKYNSILNGTAYLIREATLRNIASILPRPNEAYPALLLLDEGEMLEITNVFATDENISGEIYDVKTGFHFYFEINAGAGGEPEFTPDSTTPLFKLLKPFSAVADDDYNYTHLYETCVRPDGSYSFTSDISGLTEDTVYIAKDFSKIRIDDSVNFTGNQEYTVYAKEISIYNEIPTGGQFWFLVPDTNSSVGFVSHWVKIEAGVM